MLFSKISEVNFKKNVHYNPWLNFFSKNKIEYIVLSLKQNDIITFNANSNLYTILIGSVIIKKVFQDTSKIPLNILTNEDTFGYAEIISNDFYYEAEAIDMTQIVCVKYSQIISACHKYPQFNVFFLRHLTKCSTKTHHFIEIISHKSITNRLISLLLLLSEQNGIEYGNGILLNCSVTHKVLAKIIGSTRVSVTRIMSELIQTKLISMQKKKIIINSPILLSQRILNK